jgi:hypothetical protein
LLEHDQRFGRLHIDVAGQQIEGLSLVSLPGSSVTLSLRSIGSCPRAAQVLLTPIEALGVSLAHQVILNADEEKQLRGLAPVHFALTVTDIGPDCFALTSPVFDAGADVRKPVIVSIEPAGSIRGRSNSGTVAVVLLPPEGPIQVAIPDAESRFSFAGLRPGKYRIAARAAGDGIESRWVSDLTRMTEIQVAGGTVLEIDLAAPVQR